MSRRLALGVLALGVAGAAGGAVTLYLQREAIGVRLALDYLRAHGVPAVLRLDRLDLGGASGSMRLGSAARPDLTVGRVEAQFGALPAPWRGVRPPPLRALQLIQPVLHARWKDGRLDFGDLQPLIDQALAAKPTRAAPPDLYIRDGRLEIDTQSGPVTLAIDAAVEGGRVRSLHARLEPCDLDLAGVRLARVQGVMSGQATGLGGLHLSGAFGAASSRAERGGAAGLTLGVEALTPNGSASGAGAARPLDATVKIHAGRFALEPAHGPPLRLRQADLALDLDGQVDGGGGFTGGVRADGRAAQLVRAGAELTSAALTLRSTQAHVAAGSGGLAAAGAFTLKLSSRGGRLQLGKEEASLAPAQLSAAGRLTADRGLKLLARGDLSAGGGLPAPAAGRLARTAFGQVDPAALARTLTQVRLDVPAYVLSFDNRAGAALSLPQGVAAMGTGGRVTVQPVRGAPLFRTAHGEIDGGLGLAVRITGLPQLDLADARYRRTAAGAMRLAGTLSARGDLGPVRGGALRFAGALDGRPGAGSPGAWSLSASDCAHLASAAVRVGGAAQVLDFASDVCPQGAGALASFGPGGWSLHADLRQARAALPAGQVKLALASAQVALSGRGRAGPAGRIELAGLAVQDAAPTPRLRPVTAQGVLTLAGGQIAGRLPVTLDARGVSLGIVDVQAGLVGGRGVATLDTGRLAFAPDGLQPGDIAPAAGHLLPQAQGPLQLLARLAWSPAGVVSSGEVRSDGLDYRSPAGKIDGLRGDVRLSSLSPLASAPDQSVSADKLETLIPLTQLKAGFILTPQALALQGVSGDVAGGAVSLDPMRVPLTGADATTGVLRLHGVDLQTLIAALNLSNAVSLQAKVDGALPFALQPAAGGAPATLRLSGGRVYAEGPGRLTIARQALSGVVATAGAAGAQPNAVQDFAYQALEDLAFTELDADVASRPQGRLGVVFHVVGRHDPKLARPTRIGLFALLRGHAFDKPLPLPKGTPVDLTLDTSLNLDDILAAYGGLGGAPGSAKVQP